MVAIIGSPRFEKIKDLGSGNFGLARLEREIATGQLCAVKYIERGDGIDENVAREIVCHRLLRHPNIVMFKEVILTPSHLGIVMEYAAGGELFDRICAKGRFSESEARFFFRQLIAGVGYCHALSVAHRDLKLENALLDGNAEAPALKICDFGYSKSSLLHSMAKSTVGTPAYIAPEVLQRQAYDGRTADVWSCGVTLFVMLVGTYPFEDPAKPRDFRATIARINAAAYAFPPGLVLSDACRDLFSRIFVVDAAQRLTVVGVAAHAWTRGRGEPPTISGHSLPATPGLQTAEDINRLVEEARRAQGAAGGSPLRPPPGAPGLGGIGGGAGGGAAPMGGVEMGAAGGGMGGHPMSMAGGVGDSGGPAAYAEEFGADGLGADDEYGA